jgi:hypothetical protein
MRRMTCSSTVDRLKQAAALPKKPGFRGLDAQFEGKFVGIAVCDRLVACRSYPNQIACRQERTEWIVREKRSVI